MPFVEQSAVGKAAFEFEEGNIQHYMDRELSVPVLYHSLISLRWFL
jgi:hypothetical protein